MDIFFVISGYLISLQIIRSYENDSFSIKEFYRRRIKRIMPLLLFIVSVGLIFSQLFFLPGDAINTANSAFWAILSFANVYFWLTEDTSYFAASSEEQPFLHLWSLGVEEQFYILWPLVLVFILKKDKGRLFLPLVVGVSLLSFLFGELAYDYSPSFTYYMLPSRIGELLVGAVVAYVVNKLNSNNAHDSHYSTQAVSIFSFAIICLSFYFINENQTFPGFKAAVPTISTGILIFIGHDRTNIVKKTLSLPIFVWVGKLSYSAYLWHWLLLAFYRYFYATVTLIDALIIFLLTFILSYLSYTYIEVPFRQTKKGFEQVFAHQYLIPTILISALILGSIFTGGYVLRNDRDKFISPIDLNERKFAKHPFSFPYVCMPASIDSKDLIDPDCVLGNDPSQKPKVLLWGDSNSTHYLGMIGSFAEEAGFTFRNIALGGCPPILSEPTKFIHENWRENCIKSKPILNQSIRDYDVLILAASWSSYVSRSNEFMDELKSTLDELTQRDKKIILIGKAPEMNNFDSQCHKKKLRLPWLNCTNQPYPIADKIIDVNESAKRFADTSTNIEYYDFNKYICPTGTCYAYDKQGFPIYRDRIHIAIETSWKIGKEIIDTEGVPYPFNKIPHWVKSAK